MHQKVTLPGGLRVIVDEVPHVRSVSLGVWIGSGSRHESERVHGVSHFIEHMLFKGTERRTAKEIADAVEGRGGSLNAFTTREYTCIDARVLDEDLDIALDVMSDMVLGSLFDAQDIQKEKGVVLEEIRLSEDTPDDIIHELAVGIAWPGHPLGRDVLGTAEGVDRLSREAILSEFRERYVSGNMAVVAAGNCSLDRVAGAVERWFGGLASGEYRRAGAVPRMQAGRLVDSRPTEQAHICVVNEGVGVNSPHFYAMHLLTLMLGGSSGSRLFQKIREERGLAYSVYTYQSAFSDCGLLTTYAGTGPSTANEVVDSITAEFHSVLKDGIGEDELESARLQSKGSLLLSLESMSSRMNRLGKSELTMGRPVTADEILAGIESVTVDGLMDAARMALSPEKTAVAMIGPGKAEEGDGDGQGSGQA